MWHINIIYYNDSTYIIFYGQSHSRNSFKRRVGNYILAETIPDGDSCSGRLCESRVPYRTCETLQWPTVNRDITEYVGLSASSQRPLQKKAKKKKTKSSFVLGRFFRPENKKLELQHLPENPNHILVNGSYNNIVEH